MSFSAVYEKKVVNDYIPSHIKQLAAPARLLYNKQRQSPSKLKSGDRNVAKNRRKEYAKRRQERVLNKLAAFEEFNASFPDSVKRMLLDGATPEDVLDKHKSMVAARIVSIAMTEQDSGRALAAAKDVLDRTQGKAIERQQVEHKFGRMDEDQLDALLISKLKEAKLPELPAGSDDEED